MAVLAQHVTCRLADDRVIAPSPGRRLVVARTVLKVARTFKLIGFSLVDTHLHLLAITHLGAELGRRIQIALHRALCLRVPFARARPKDIADQWHLQNSVVYLARQQLHHEVELDLFHEGSSLPDLLGLRVCGDYVAKNVRHFTPRLAGDGLRKAVARVDHPASLKLPRLLPASAPLDLLPEAAAAAIGLPELEGRSAAVVDARRAAIAIVGPRLTNRQVARLFGIGRSTAARLSRQPANPLIVKAIRLQLGLRRARLGAAEHTVP